MKTNVMAVSLYAVMIATAVLFIFTVLGLVNTQQVARSTATQNSMPTPMQTPTTLSRNPQIIVTIVYPLGPINVRYNENQNLNNLEWGWSIWSIESADLNYSINWGTLDRHPQIDIWFNKLYIDLVGCGADVNPRAVIQICPQ